MADDPSKTESRAAHQRRGQAGCKCSDLERKVMLGTVLVVLLVLMLLGALPTWPHSRSWGYYPSGGLGLLLTILVVLLLLGKI
jgi:hypothetical protein